MPEPKGNLRVVRDLGMMTQMLLRATTGDRVLPLLLLQSVEPLSWDRSWQSGESFDSFNQFVSNGQSTSAD